MLLRLFALLLGLSVVSGCAASNIPGEATLPSGPGMKPLVKQTGGSNPQWEALTTSSTQADDLITGPDGNVWYIDTGDAVIGRVTMTGVVTKFLVPHRNSQPIYFADDRGASTLWFTERVRGLAAIGTNGAIVEYADPHASQWYHFDVALGPDGNLWMTVNDRHTGAAAVEKVTTTGRYLATYNLDGSNAQYIVRGSDGNLWVDEDNEIGKLTTSGQLTEYSGFPTHVGPRELVLGPDGNVWALATPEDKIARIKPNGNVTLFSLANACSQKCDAFVITVGPDKNIWWAEPLSKKIGYFNLRGQNTVLDVPFSGYPLAITAGPDGNVWFTESGAVDVYVRLVLNVSPQSIVFQHVGDSQTLTVTETNYSGNWVAKSADPSVASVMPGSTKNTFVVVAGGTGSTTVTVADQKQNSFPVSVSVR